MLYMILKILSIIGIVLLCILGLLLLALICILFIPVRYRANGSYLPKETFLHIKITWLLHLVSVVYDYPDPGTISIKILGFPISVNKKQKEKILSDNQEETKKQNEPKETQESAVLTREEPEESPPLQVEAETAAKEKVESKRPSFFHKIEQIFQRIRKSFFHFFHKIRYTIVSFYDKIKKIVVDFAYYKDLFQEEENRLLFTRCLKRLGMVIKNIRPSKLSARLLIGTGSPDTTGYLMALYSMFTPYLGKHIDIIPDFEQAVLQGDFKLKGCVTAFVLLVNGGKIYFDKQFQLFMKKLTREEK